MKTNVRDTSLLAFGKLLPHLGPRQSEVYELLKKKGGMTNTEIAVELGRTINCITGRTYELVKLELVVEGEKRMCRETGMTAKEWLIKR